MKRILLVEYLVERIVFFIERFGNNRLDIAETSDDAIFYLEEKKYDYIFLGGSLSKSGDSCFKVAQFLATDPGNYNSHSTIVLHSWNVFEVQRILDLLPNAKRLPYDEHNFSAFDI